MLQNGGLRIDNTATIATGAAGKWNISTDAGIRIFDVSNPRDTPQKLTLPATGWLPRQLAFY